MSLCLCNNVIPNCGNKQNQKHLELVREHRQSRQYNMVELSFDRGLAELPEHV